MNSIPKTEQQLKASVLRLFWFTYMIDLELSLFNFGWGTKYLNELGTKAMRKLREFLKFAEQDLRIKDSDAVQDIGDKLWEINVMLSTMEVNEIDNFHKVLKQHIHTK